MLGPISGRYSDRVGTRWLTVAGMGLSAAGILMFARPTVDSTSGYVIAGILVHCIGIGIFSSPNTSAMLTAVPNERFRSASAFLNLTRTAASLAGIAMTTAIVTLIMGAMGFEPSPGAITEDGGEEVKTAFVTGMGRAYTVAAGLLLPAMAVSAFRGENPASGPRA